MTRGEINSLDPSVCSGGGFKSDISRDDIMPKNNVNNKYAADVDATLSP